MNNRNPFDIADILNGALEEAREKRLEAEIIVSILQHLSISRSKLEDAIAFAFSEWDI